MKAMSKKAFIAVVSILLILVSLTVEASANPYWAGFTSPKDGENYPIITVISPQNTVYHTNNLTLNVTIPSQCDRFGKISYMYIEEIFYNTDWLGYNNTYVYKQKSRVYMLNEEHYTSKDFQVYFINIPEGEHSIQVGVVKYGYYPNEDTGSYQFEVQSLTTCRFIIESYSQIQTMLPNILIPPLKLPPLLSSSPLPIPTLTPTLSPAESPTQTPTLEPSLSASPTEGPFIDFPVSSLQIELGIIVAVLLAVLIVAVLVYLKIKKQK
jgi:hypothetical protein